MSRTARHLSLCAAVLMVAVTVPARGGDAAAGWYVAAYAGRITSADREGLDRAGAEGVQYRPSDSYLAWLTPDAVDAVAGLPHVTSVRPLRPSEKLAATLDLAAHPLVDVVVWGGAPRATLASLGEVAEVVRSFRPTPDRSLLNVVVRADAAAVSALASDPRVLSIGPAATGIELLDEGAAQIVAGNIAAGKPVVGYRAFLDGLGLDGSGVTIAIADSGIDDTHPDLMGRVVSRTDYTPLPDFRDSDGHGTHVSGIAGGSGVGIPGATDPTGFAYGQGIAPAVRFVDAGVLGIIEELVGVDEFPPFEQVSRDASRAGAIGWNASWGSGEGDRAGYTVTSRTMDVIARDADWETPGAQPFTLVFAAGNSGTAGPGAPTEAKNLIAVASSKSHRASGTIDQISTFSSRGPTKDGRIGPTVAAPGETIVSTRSLPASVLCNQPPAEAAPFAAFYGTCSGTSMAAPQVTGSVALIAQWWRRDHDGATPSPAMSKALLVNSATDMGTADIPNRNEGWGRVNLKALFDPTVERVLVDQEVVLDEAGESHVLRVAPADPSRPMRATLVWSDAPASPNALPAIVNDLDLSLVAEDGATYLGNRFAGGGSIPGGAPDRLEVVENVFLPSPSGTYTLTVDAFNVPGDGVPFAGDATDQDFALVISNAVVVPA
ncbi:MAG TPA: S8 family serine peptidase [Actinomycetota bacterium]